jgi:predicted nucleic acid-binding protein
MIVLNTNVVSELMRPSPQPTVVRWLDDRPPSITTTVQGGMSGDVRRAARRSGLTDAAERAFGVLFAGRIIPFDSLAARAFAAISASRRAAWRPISHADCQIAAIARSREAQVATRDARGFQGCGIDVINPWAQV